MINLPAYSGAVFFALILADLLLLILFFIAAGPMFISARDAFGRPIESVSAFKRFLLVVVTLIFAAYFAVQVALLGKFLPYFIDGAETKVERITALTPYPDDEAPVALWVTTERHRFGVTEEVFDNLGVGDLVEVRFRPFDDTLYEIRVVRRAQEDRSPAASPPPSPAP